MPRRTGSPLPGRIADHLEDWVDVVDMTLGVYGDTHYKDQRDGHFDFATLVIDPEFVMVRRSSLVSLIEEVKGVRQDKTIAQGRKARARPKRKRR